MKAFVFPGQGSQKKGMGKDLFDNYCDLVQIADKILGYSIKELCLEDSKNVLTHTQYAQPALYVVNALSYLNRQTENKETPDFFLGFSLGEYNALYASRVFSFETGLKIVKKRGEIMAKIKNGCMAAIIGLSAENIQKVLDKNLFFNLQIANYNSPEQIVISGLEKDIKDGKEIFEANGARTYIPLDVSGAFHSKFMNIAALEFSDFLDKFEFSDLTTPVISNVYAMPYDKNNIKETLAKQINYPVKWQESIEYIMRRSEVEFYEIGDSKVLTGLINKIKKGLVFSETVEKV